MPIYPITFSIHESKILSSPPPKSHFLSPTIPTNDRKYLYDTEQDYYQSYQQSVFAITCRKGGWDCLRHYEIIANGCIPYFIDIQNCPPPTLSTFPKELIQESNKLYETIIQKKVLDEEIIDECNRVVQVLLEYAKRFLTNRAIAGMILSKIFPINPKKVLFLSGITVPDYQRCLTLSGFKDIFGQDCHDYPKIPHIYTDYSEDITKLYGRGMTYTKIHPPMTRDDKLDETVEEDIRKHWYDIVVYGEIHHPNNPFIEIVRENYKKSEIVWICGADVGGCKCNDEKEGEDILFIRERDGK